MDLYLEFLIRQADHFYFSGDREKCISSIQKIQDYTDRLEAHRSAGDGLSTEPYIGDL